MEKVTLKFTFHHLINGHVSSGCVRTQSIKVSNNVRRRWDEMTSVSASLACCVRTFQGFILLCEDVLILTSLQQQMRRKVKIWNLQMKRLEEKTARCKPQTSYHPYKLNIQYKMLTNLIGEKLLKPSEASETIKNELLIMLLEICRFWATEKLLDHSLLIRYSHYNINCCFFCGRHNVEFAWWSMSRSVRREIQVLLYVQYVMIIQESHMPPECGQCACLRKVKWS